MGFYVLLVVLAACAVYTEARTVVTADRIQKACASQEALALHQAKCFAGLPLPSGVTLENILYQGLTMGHLISEELCNNSDNYTAAIHCAMDLGRACAEMTGRSPKAFPENQNIASGVAYVCEGLKEFDRKCLKEMSGAVTMCTMQFVDKMSDAKSGICKFLDAAATCADANMATHCGGRTGEIIRTWLTKYMLAPIC